MTRRPLSLQWRITLTGLIWLVVGLSVSALMIRLAFLDSIERSTQMRLAANLRAVLAVVDITPDGTVALSHRLEDPRFDQPLSGWYWQVADDQGAILRSRSLWDQVLPTHPPPSDSGSTVFGRTMGPKSEPLITAERDIQSYDPPRSLHITLAAPAAQMNDEIKSFDRVLGLSFLALAIGLSVGMVAQVMFGLRPLRRLAADLTAAGRSPDRRMDDSYPAEITPLTDALNQVMDHDRRLVERAKTHVGNLAHGLKTPLAVMRADLSSGVADPHLLLDQIDRMQRLVDHHLTQARIQAGTARIGGQQTPIRPLIDDICRTLAKIAAARGVSLHNDCPTDLQSSLSADDLAEIIGNLLENACKWAKSGVWIQAEQGQTLTLRIEDDGPGMAVAQQSLAVQRGLRLDERQPGHGLGLSIVQDVVDHHGGRMMLSTSPRGGLMVSVTLPIMGVPPDAKDHPPHELDH